MHLAEGLLSGTVLAAGAAGSAVGVGIGLWRLDEDRIPRVAVLSSAFFVASLIHLPVGMTEAHLLLTGLAGLILGWTAFPALLVALLLQFVLFGYGGLTTLGGNTLTMALPAVICYFVFSDGVRHARRSVAAVLAFLCGAVGVALAAGFTLLALVASGEGFVEPGYALVAFHLPVMGVEGLVTAFVALFLRRVRPELLCAPLHNLRKGDDLG
ncbi:MAG: cobalt transporter CbiM [Planctomycetota bacterium]